MIEAKIGRWPVGVRQHAVKTLVRLVLANCSMTTSLPPRESPIVVATPHPSATPHPYLPHVPHASVQPSQIGRILSLPSKTSIPEKGEIPEKGKKGTACLPCSRHHVTTVGGALSEAVRFARSDGLGHPEVLKRLAISEQELDIMERVDLTPSNILELSSRDGETARWIAGKGRDIRHLLDEMKTVEDLERATAQVQDVNIEYRARLANLSPQDTERLKALVKDVKTGKLTKDEAVAKLKGG